ncbi:MAG: hypothetical protein WCJ37_12110, partial [Syntrophus sp. (in: bacteria)]
MRIEKAFIAATILLLATTALAERGRLQVTVSPVPPNLSAQVAFTEPSGNRILDADETGKLLITLQNRGKGDAFDVRAAIKASGKTEGLEFDRDVIIGTVPAGGTVKKEIALKAAEDIPTTNISLTVEIREANGFDPNPMKVSFKTKAFEPPKLVVADVGVTDQKGSGRIEPGGIVELTVRVQNIGHGDAREAVADVQTGKNVFIAADSVTHFELGN